MRDMQTVRETHVELEDLDAEAVIRAATIRRSFEGSGI